MSYKFNQSTVWAHNHMSRTVGYGYVSTCDEWDVILLYQNWYMDSREGQKKK